MKNVILMFATVMSLYTVKAQNLVPNPSFELYDTCPNNYALLNYATSWTNPLYHASPDYFNSCDTSGTHIAGVPSNFVGFEPAHTGNGYAGIITYRYNNPSLHLNNYREYIQVQLIDSLISNLNYCIQFYVSPSDSSRYITNDIGIYFSNAFTNDTCPGYPCTLPFIPQFENSSSNNLNNRNGWTLVSGIYTAIGGEKYIILGNFKDSTTTVATNTGWSFNSGFVYAYYYIDDILITPCDSLHDEVKNISNLISDVHLFPSVAESEIIIESSNECIKQINIISVFGEPIFILKEINQKQKIPININLVSSGVYIATITTNKKTYNLKFIKK